MEERKQIEEMTKDKIREEIIREQFHKLKTVDELDADDIVANLEIEIEDYEYKAKNHDDDYAIDVSVLPTARAAFFQRIVDVIESQQEEIRRLKEANHE